MEFDLYFPRLTNRFKMETVEEEKYKTKAAATFLILAMIYVVAKIIFIGTVSAQSPIADYEFTYAELVTPGQDVEQYMDREPNEMFFYIGKDSLAVLKDVHGPNYLKLEEIREVTVEGIPHTLYALRSREDDRYGTIVGLAHMVDDIGQEIVYITFIVKGGVALFYETQPVLEVTR